jgi:hypothetical protein
LKFYCDFCLSDVFSQPVLRISDEEILFSICQSGNYAAQKKYLAVHYLLAPNLQRRKALMVCKLMKNRSGNAASPACACTVGRREFMKKLLFGLRRLGLLLVELLRYIVMLPVGKVPPEGWT